MIRVEHLEERTLLTNYFLMVSAPASIISGTDLSVSVIANPDDAAAPPITEFRFDLGGDGMIDAVSASGAATFSSASLATHGYSLEHVADSRATGTPGRD